MTVSRGPSALLAWVLRVVGVVGLVGVGIGLGTWIEGRNAQREVDALEERIRDLDREVGRLENAVEAAQPTVPDVTGQSISEAHRLLAAAGLSVGSDTLRPLGPDGVVADQWPSPGERVPFGTGVVLLGPQERPQVAAATLDVSTEMPAARLDFPAPEYPTTTQMTVTITFGRGTPSQVEADIMTRERRIPIDLADDACSVDPEGFMTCIVQFEPMTGVATGGWTAHLRHISGEPVRVDLHIQFDRV